MYKFETIYHYHMYISKQNLTTDENEIIEFITQYSFAAIVTSNNDRPNASHLPFVIEKRGDKTILIGHFAKANPQWKELLNNEVLVVFSEPHAYISPKLYDKELNVPTWNYIAVHAYGKARILSETTHMLEVMEKSINAFEADYMTQWNKLPEEYKLKMLNGIVAFEIEVSSFEASKKLSQNKTSAEQHRIIESLSRSEHDVERQIGIYMKKEIKDL